MKKTFAIVSGIIFAFCLFLQGCTPAGLESSLVGIWEGEIDYSIAGINYNEKITLTIEYNDTGKFEFEDVDGAYEGDDDFNISFGDSCKKLISFEFDNFYFMDGTYKYNLNGSQLTIYDFKVGGDSSGKVTVDLDLSK
jgi:hypothetical protein